ncbi:MAG: hypothetical protein RM368_22830 [Nostoc sp. DedSLP03]|nr:hypothetical protein [Nostoc sp. DedSLP03]
MFPLLLEKIIILAVSVSQGSRNQQISQFTKPARRQQPAAASSSQQQPDRE